MGDSYEIRIEKAKKAIQDAEYILLGGGVGLSAAAGITYSGKRFEIQGNNGYLQCAQSCHDKRYHNERLVSDMVEKTVDCKIPSELIPICPVCGGEMVPTFNQYFVHDEQYFELEALYKDFVLDSVGKKRIYLGLGIESATVVRLENDVETIAFIEDMQEVVPALMK